MPKIPKINTDFDSLSDSLFYDTSMLILNSISDNSGDFGGLPTDMSTFEPQISVFNKVRHSVFYPAKTADTLKLRAIVQKTITGNGNWINSNASGDVSLLKKSGYPLQKEDEAQGKLDATVLTLTPSKVAGEIEYAISYIKIKALKYGIMVTPVENTELDPSKWTGFRFCPQRDGVLTGFASKVNFKFSSFAMGTDGNLTYSEPVIMAAQ